MLFALRHGSKGEKWTWKHTLVVVLSGEIAIQTTASKPTLETLTIVSSLDVVIGAKLVERSPTVTQCSGTVVRTVNATVPRQKQRAVVCVAVG